MKVYVAKFHTVCKTMYGSHDHSRVIGIFSTASKAKTALKAAMVESVRDCGRGMKKGDLIEFSEKDFTEYNYERSFVDGGYDTCIGSVWAEEVR